MFEAAQKIIQDAQKIIVIQAENPDGDSLGSALALEEILSDQGKQVSLYCPVDIPKYLRYTLGWDRVNKDFDFTADAAIIVDTASQVLLSKVLQDPAVKNFLHSNPVLVIDHHQTKPDLSFKHVFLSQDCVASSHVVYNLAQAANWSINQRAAENLMIALMSDSLGLTTPNVTAESYLLAANLVKLGANNALIEERRREFMKKEPEILAYKGKLIERIEYFLDGKLALVQIPFKEIATYSDKYNPSMLVLDEMRLVKKVALAVAIKTYPDGKLTAKIRANLPIAEQVAGYFGGGGHDYAAGFRTYEKPEVIINELIAASHKILKNFEEN